MLADAAVVVRLLNDLGPLVTLDTYEQDTLVRELTALYRQSPCRYPTLSELILAYAKENPVVTRLFKDIKNGEFNVGLYNLMDIRSVEDSLPIFRNNLAQFARIYTGRYADLLQNLDSLAERLNEDRISNMILRFVEFHRKMYSELSTSVVGEYAI